MRRALIGLLALTSMASAYRPYYSPEVEHRFGPRFVAGGTLEELHYCAVGGADDETVFFDDPATPHKPDMVWRRNGSTISFYLREDLTPEEQERYGLAYTICTLNLKNRS